ncbi:uncharacterized protein [Rutidosis leptorrhynchoides]|uniref:uncharacterized protein n=1 Tax=Rutidosis leptorrhynchoides TaxID=125765 RepID=UPI003A99E562
MFPPMQNYGMIDVPVIFSCKIANTEITIMKVHIDIGSSVDIIYEQCFRKLPESIKAELIPTVVSLSGFAGESAWSVGQLPLKIELVDETDAKLMRQAWLDLYVMQFASRYNKLLGRSALSKFCIIPSTIHGMIKFATCKGVATMNSAMIQPICAAVNMQGAVIESAGAEDNMVVINRAYPEKTIKIGNNLDADVKNQLVQLLIANMDVFAWCEQEMTGVPRKIAEHILNANPALKPIIQKRGGMAPDRMKWLCREVTKLIDAGILREVKYQTWVANPVLVKKLNGSWQMCIDFKDINKA